ncbi:MAG: tRNA lysidine(34) synthetase TilS [Huintestinicola sp.]|uniref:tRNA lysidine(34) synthetase TilS n=1 Tax=Huintestinicola sp. TaxID=2981661 RepID=UPI003F0298E2
MLRLKADMGVVDTVRETVSRYGMIPEGSRVIACLSGGADSVCLLRVLHMLRDETGFSLYAVHVNHCLRGEESDRDMHFCEELCRELDIPLSVYHVDVKGYCAENGTSAEEGARILRYGAFEKESQKLGGALIATAHNKGDNSETVIFNLARGTGIRGLRGIPHKRDCIIRPLLGVTRAEIEEFLTALGQGFVTDSTNLTEDYSRNVIRHRVVPVLEGINGNFAEAVSRLSESAAEDEEYFEELIKTIPENEICGYPPSVRKRYIRKLLSVADIECSYERLSILDGMMVSGKNTKYQLKGDVFAVFKGGVMEIMALPSYDKIFFDKQIDFLQNAETVIPEFDKTVIIRRVCNDILKSGTNIQKKLTNHLVSCDKIQGVVTLRNKRDGDRICFHNRGVTTKLKKHFNALKLSDNERNSALVMEDEVGVFWCEYGGAAERVFPESSESPENIFEISVRKTADNDYRDYK